MEIREDFKNLIRPLSEEEYKRLEISCMCEGIRDPLVLWGDVLIDGHNRYEIAQKHNLEYKTVNHKFPDDNAAKVWIIQNQIGRRNLSAYDRSVLALELKPLIQEKAKAQQIRKSVCQKSDKQKPIDTKKELASFAGVSHDTIHKVEAIEEKASPETKQLIREGKLSINQAYNKVRPKPSDIVKEAMQEHERFKEKKKESVINIKDIKIDNTNKKIINANMMSDLLKSFSSTLKFYNDYGDKMMLLGELEDNDKNIVRLNCSQCEEILFTIERSIEE